MKISAALAGALALTIASGSYALAAGKSTVAQIPAATPRATGISAGSTVQSNCVQVTVTYMTRGQTYTVTYERNGTRSVKTSAPQSVASGPLTKDRVVKVAGAHGPTSGTPVPQVV